MEYYKSTRIHTPKGCISGILAVDNGYFAGIIQGETDLPVRDFGDKRIIPGIIDTHNHGVIGYRFSDSDVKENVESLLIGEASFGVTGVFATINKAYHLPPLADIIESNPNGARILGIQSQGPFGSRVGENGDPNHTYYQPVDLDYCRQMVENGRGHLTVVDIAPEVNDALEAIRYFVSKGIFTSAYDTNATYEECNRGIEAGISLACHLGNVMTGLHHRGVGTFGACLLSDAVTCEFICDGLHVSNPMLKIITTVKDHDKLMIISDNSEFSGLPKGRYRGTDANSENDQKIINVSEEGFVLSETGRISGSGKPVLYGLGNLVENVGVDLEDAIRMTSYNPSVKYHLKNRGSISIGNYADFVVISDDWQALNTFVEGREVWNSETDVRPYNEKFLREHRITD